MNTTNLNKDLNNVMLSSIGIIFYEIKKDKMYIYLKQNTKDYYEDIIKFNSSNLINFIKEINNNIGSLFKLFINNHTILILNKNKYNNIFDEICNFQEMVKINLSWFNNKNVHNNLKHNRIKNIELNNLLNLIYTNYRFRL